MKKFSTKILLLLLAVCVGVTSTAVMAPRAHASVCPATSNGNHEYALGHYYESNGYSGHTMYVMCQACGARVGEGGTVGHTLSTSWNGCYYTSSCNYCSYSTYGYSHSWSPYTYTYKDGTTHTGTSRCTECGTTDTTTGNHSTTDHYAPHSDIQHTVEAYCATCDSVISTSTSSHAYVYENWAKVDNEQCGRGVSCTLCTYTGTVYQTHTDGDGDNLCDSCAAQISVNVSFRDRSVSNTIMVRYESTVPAPSDPERAGYDFVTWLDTNGNEYDFNALVIEDIILDAKWAARSDTAYQVRHYQQNVAGDGYALVDTENLTGTTDTTATAVAESYTGFHENDGYADRVTSGNINGDGSLVLALYYDRDIITISIDLGQEEPLIQEIPYGGTIAKPEDLTKTGYIFDGWKDENGNLFDFNSPVTGDITLTPSWTAKSDTPYQVQHYFQTVIGNEYILQDIDYLTAATDSLAEAVAKASDGFHVAVDHPNQITSGNVNGDGSLVLSLYYNRDFLTISIDLGQGDPLTQEIPYGGTIARPEDPSRPGYDFEAWVDEDGQTYDFDTPVYAESYIFAKWAAKHPAIIAMPQRPQKQEDMEDGKTPLSGFSDLNNKQLTRAEAALLFANWMKAPVNELEITTKFDDVTAETEYAPFITWADNAHVEVGYGERRFGPTDTLTREQLALMLYRVYGNESWADLTAFTDGDTVSEWAHSAICWAVSKNLLPTMDDGKLKPRDGVTGLELTVQLQKAAELTPPVIIASGECGDQGDNITWTLTADGVLILRGSGAMCCAYDKSTQKSLEEMEDTDLSWLFPWRKAVKKVVFEGEITTIGESTFIGCDELVEITLPDSLTEIGRYAFCGCLKMELTEIPTSVTTIRYGAFEGCISMSLPAGYTLPFGVQGYTPKGGA